VARVPAWVIVAVLIGFGLTVTGLVVAGGSIGTVRVATVFVALPAAILAMLLLSAGRRPGLLLGASFLIDAETLLVASTWVVGLAYAMLLPLIGLVLVLGVLRDRALRLAFALAGATSFAGIVIALVEDPTGSPIPTLSLATTVVASGLLISFGYGYLWKLHDRLASAVARAASEMAARTAAESELRRLATAVEQADDVVFISDEQRRILYANPAFERVTGYPVPEALGRTIKELIRSNLHDEAFYNELREATASGRGWSGTIINRRRDGTPFDFEVSMSPLYDPTGAFVGSVTVGRDRTDARRMVRDAVLQTELRSAMLEHLHDLPDGASSEQAGEALCDAFVSLPQVQFAAVFAFEGAEGIRSIAHRAPPGFPTAAALGSADRGRAIRAKVQQGPSFAEYWRQAPGDVTWGDALTQMGLVAVAFGPIVHGDHVDGVVALGTADPAFGRALVERLPAVLDLSTTPSALLAERLHQRRVDVETRAALELVVADQAFQSVYQPIVDLATDEVAGYEALTRFDSGMAPETAFANAWRVGLGPRLELTTLQRAILGAGALPPGRWLDINVSPALLADREPLADILRDADRPLVIEITEHQAVGDYAAIRALVSGLGPDVRLAVDDAGAGVANFGHIVELRPDLVKLDRSLVREVNTNLGRQALVIAMSHFAKTAGCRLVAEGIETPAELRTLASLGVEFGQGYLLGRPASPLELARRRRPAVSSRPAATGRRGSRDSS
jgi:PAS domain S-box-containing protein